MLSNSLASYQRPQAAELRCRLAGRFELLHLPHWSFGEMRDALDLSAH